MSITFYAQERVAISYFLGDDYYDGLYLVKAKLQGIQNVVNAPELVSDLEGIIACVLIGLEISLINNCRDAATIC